ncbi:hypothetical protein Dda_9083 [Drechslerella dactyloides]|uniref:Uncharacterized protein n=1 Tax=Drechslerella dactyloides TaxID=74499 RepID=A0AAD6IPW1_DREDA|nr:hypothetical protein Dda_9083 [Drechslerella dactyloides]
MKPNDAIVLIIILLLLFFAMILWAIFHIQTIIGWFQSSKKTIDIEDDLFLTVT